MSKPKVTEREVRSARSFLKTIGGSQTNTYLLLAVIAWMRAMAKAHDPFWKSLAHYSAYSAGVRLAKQLAARVRADGKNYKGVLAALHRNAKGDSKLAEQAVDFMLAIEGSKWDKHHFGYMAYVPGHYETQWVYEGGGQPVQQTVWVPEQQEFDPMRQAWAELTDHPNIPAKWYTDTVTTKHTVTVPPRPHQPRSLLHVLPKADYILPYHAVNFYEAKPHYGDNVLLSD